MRRALILIIVLSVVSFGGGICLDLLQARTAQRYLLELRALRAQLQQGDLIAARGDQAHLHALWQHDAQWLSCLISHHHTRAVSGAMLRLSTALEMGWPVEAMLALDDAYDALEEIRTADFPSLQNLL